MMHIVVSIKTLCLTQVYKDLELSENKMTDVNKMPNEINKILTNNMGKCLRTGKEAPKLIEKQLETLKRYKEYYEQLPSPRGGKNKVTSVWNAVWALRRLAIFLKLKSFEEATKEDIVNYLKTMDFNSDTTRSRSKTYIRMFYKWLYGIKEKHKYPEVVDDPRIVPDKTKNKKKPSQLLTPREILSMLEIAGNDRNRSIIMLSLGEGGLRAGEISSLNISSVEFDEKGCKVWIEQSKSKERYVRIIKGEPYLRNYINNEYILHKDKSDNPLFYCVAGGNFKQRLVRNAFAQLLKRIGKKAGITKRIYTHLGRSINISNLTKKGISAEISAKRFGITPKTLRDVYLTIDDKDVDDVYCQIEGKLTEEEKKKLKEEEDLLMPKTCPRCQNTVPKNALYCNCGMIVSEVEAIRVQESQDKFMESLKKLNRISPEAMIKFVETVTKLDEEIND